MDPGNCAIDEIKRRVVNKSTLRERVGKVRKLS